MVGHALDQSLPTQYQSSSLSGAAIGSKKNGASAPKENEGEICPSFRIAVLDTSPPIEC